MPQLPFMGGFSPLPVSMMVPFMEMQSATLARAFGINYEVGKRQIKSMSNEDFNNLTEEGINEMIHHSAVSAVKEFQKQMPGFADIQQQITTEYIKLEKMKIEANIALIKSFGSTVWQTLGLPYFPGNEPDPNADPTKFNPPPKNPFGDIEDTPITNNTTTHTNKSDPNSKTTQQDFRKFTQPILNTTSATNDFEMWQKRAATYVASLSRLESKYLQLRDEMFKLKKIIDSKNANANETASYNEAVAAQNKYSKYLSDMKQQYKTFLAQSQGHTNTLIRNDAIRRWKKL